MTQVDFDMGTGSLQVSSKRYINSIKWLRNKDTGCECITTTTIQESEVLDPGETIVKEGETIGSNTYVVTLNSQVIDACAGHNEFLNEIKKHTNNCINEFIASGSSTSATGSVTLLRRL